MGDIIKQIEWGTVLFQLVAFILLFLGLRKVAIKPIIAIMVERQKNIEKNINEAKENQQLSAQLLAQQKELLDQSKKEASEIIKAARSEANSEADKIINLSKEQSNKIIENAKKEIEIEKIAVMRELQNEVAQISVQLSSAILKKEVQKETYQNEINEFLTKVGNANE